MAGRIGVPSTADILWTAAIDDNTDQFFQNFEKNLSFISVRAADAFHMIYRSSELMGFGILAASNLAAAAIWDIIKALLRLGQAAVQEIGETIEESIQLAARADTLAVSLRVVGANAGYTQDELAKYEQGLRDANISQIAARETLLQMIQANLDLGKSIELANVAKDAAIISDTNSSEALQRIIHGISTLNPLILNRMRLLVDLDSATQNYANANDLATDAISKETKVSILLNEVLKAGANIAGAYDAAMNTAGKRARSLERIMQDLQVQIGQVFQPAYLQWILFLEGTMGRMSQFFTDNADAVDEWGRRLGAGASLAIDAMNTLIDLVDEFASRIGDAIDIGEEFIDLLGAFGPKGGIYLADFLAQVIGLETHLSELENTAAKGLTFIAVVFVVSLKVMKDAVLVLADSVIGAVATIVGAEEVAEAALARILTRLGGEGKALEPYMAEIDQLVEDLFNRIGLLTGAIEDTGEAAPALDPLIDKTKELAKELADAARKIADINEKIRKEMLEVAIDIERETFEFELSMARRREDLARQYARRIASIWDNYRYRRQRVLEDLADEEKELEEDQADERAEAAKDHARDLIDIEIEYQRELEDIKRDFWDTAEEAARKNDAVAVARAMREAARQRRDAAIERDRDIDDANRDYERELEDLKEAQEKRKKELKKDRDERLKDLEEDLRRQLELAQEGHAEQLDDLELYLRRRKEDIDRHRKWDAEDRQRKWDEELAEAGAFIGHMEYIESQHLQNLLELHGQYIENDLALWQAYWQARYRSYVPGTLPIPIPGEDEENQGWGYAGGGLGLATTPTNIMVGEVPELFAAIPLNAMMRHDIHMSGGFSIGGVSPAMEQNLMPQMMEIMRMFGQQLLSGMGQT